MPKCHTIREMAVTEKQAGASKKIGFKTDTPLVRTGWAVCIVMLVLPWFLPLTVHTNQVVTTVSRVVMTTLYFLGLLYVAAAVASLRYFDSDERRERVWGLDGVIQQQLKEKFFDTLARIHFQLIETYYHETREQAKKGFRLAAMSLVVSLIVVLAGVVMVYLDKTQVGYVTAVAGAVGDIIAGWFFFLHNRTVTKMAEYHQKLIVTQNVSLALKIAEDLPESERTKAKMALITALTKDVNKVFANVANAPKSSTPRTHKPTSGQN
jgi:hypothetical protein